MSKNNTLETSTVGDRPHAYLQDEWETQPSGQPSNEKQQPAASADPKLTAEQVREPYGGLECFVEDARHQVATKDYADWVDLRNLLRIIDEQEAALAKQAGLRRKP
ncbi:MAG: hypothetical protein ACYDHE_21140 [Candidatus Acidiferrales bacterium]